MQRIIICYAPILPYSNDEDVSAFFGYDYSATVPYIMEITLEFYGSQKFAVMGEFEGVQFGTVFIPPFAIYPTEIGARMMVSMTIKVSGAEEIQGATR